VTTSAMGPNWLKQANYSVSQQRMHSRNPAIQSARRSRRAITCLDIVSLPLAADHQVFRSEYIDGHRPSRPSIIVCSAGDVPFVDRPDDSAIREQRQLSSIHHRSVRMKVEPVTDPNLKFFSDRVEFTCIPQLVAE